MNVKSVILSLLVLLGCFGFTGCDDEFGIMKLYANWKIYVPEGKIKEMYRFVNEEKKIVTKQKSEKDNFDLFVIPCGQGLETRRDFSSSDTITIVFNNDKEEIFNVKVFIPYLKNENKRWERIEKEKELQDINIIYIFEYDFNRYI